MANEFGVMSDEQRAASRARALEVRSQRADIKRQMKAGELSFAEVADKRGDVVVDRMPVVQAIAAMPGYGRATALRIMSDIGIDENRRMRGLGSRQLKALIEILDK